jgi:hypothetical protein
MSSRAGHDDSLSSVVLLDIAQDADVLVGDEVDGNTLASESTGPADAVDVVCVRLVRFGDRRH